MQAAGRIAPWPSWTKRFLNTLPGDLDRFLGTFFARRAGPTQISYDPQDRRLLLELRLADSGLSADDRFCSLVEYFVRAERDLVRRRTGDALTSVCTARTAPT